MEAKTIYCPSCGRKVFNHNGRGTITLRGKCDKCNKLVIYNPLEDKTEIKNIPPRASLSGKVFW